MKIKIKSEAILPWMLLMVSAGSVAAQTQSVSQTKDKPHPELALTYTYEHSNAPAGGCGCFSLNGGAATFAWPLHRFALVGDLASTHAGNVNGGSSLTLTTYTAGARYEQKLPQPKLRPFAQILVGGAHASGTLDSGNAFAANIGGGLNADISRRLGIRVIEADYLVTTFDNNSNNHQNNLRISTGLLVRF